MKFRYLIYLVLVVLAYVLAALLAYYEAQDRKFDEGFQHVPQSSFRDDRPEQPVFKRRRHDHPENKHEDRKHKGATVGIQRFRTVIVRQTCRVSQHTDI